VACAVAAGVSFPPALISGREQKLAAPIRIVAIRRDTLIYLPSELWNLISAFLDPEMISIVTGSSFFGAGGTSCATTGAGRGAIRDAVRGAAGRSERGRLAAGGRLTLPPPKSACIAGPGCLEIPWS